MAQTKLGQTNLLFRDFFKRRDQTGWGTKWEYGGAYGTTGTVSDWSISTNRGRIPFGGGNTTFNGRRPLSSPLWRKDTEIVGRFSFDTVPALVDNVKVGFAVVQAENVAIEFCARAANGEITPMVRHRNPTDTDEYAGSAIAYTAGEQFWIKCIYSLETAHRVRLKVWKVGTPEPNWQVDQNVTDINIPIVGNGSFYVFGQQATATVQGAAFVYEVQGYELYRNLFRDTFNRETYDPTIPSGQGFWSPPDPDEPGAQGYSVHSGVGSTTAYVYQNRGHLIAPGAASTIRYVRMSTSQADTLANIGISGDFEMTTLLGWGNALPASGTVFQSGFFLYDNDTDGRYHGVSIDSVGNIILTSGVAINATWTRWYQTPTIATWAPGEEWYFKIRRWGNIVYMKTWASIVAEPDWQCWFQQKSNADLGATEVPENTALLGWGWWCQNTDTGKTLDFTFGDQTIRATTTTGVVGSADVGKLREGSATTLYFEPTTVASPGTLPLASFWNVTAGALRRKLSRTKSNVANSGSAVAETSSSRVNVMHRHFVSEPLARQRIEGTFRGLVNAEANQTSSDPLVQCSIRVYSSDLTTLRGTLYQSAGNATTGNLIAGIYQNVNIADGSIPSNSYGDPFTLTPLDVLDGDYLVVEIGARHTNTTATSRSASFYWNTKTTNTLPQGAFDTGAPFIQFSQTILFQDEN